MEEPENAPWTVKWVLVVIMVATSVVAFGVLPAQATSGSKDSVAASSAIGTAVLDYFFPRNGTDFEAGWTFSNFTQTVQDKAVDQCLESDGFNALPPVENPYSGSNEEFPDLAYLKAHGFLVTMPPTH